MGPILTAPASTQMSEWWAEVESSLLTFMLEEMYWCSWMLFRMAVMPRFVC